MEKEYITSDCHFWHKNIIKFCGRPFEFSDAGVDRMNEVILKSFDDVPDEKGITIWNLGDVFFGKAVNDKTFEELKVFVDRMKGKNRKLNLILGNHDREAFKRMPIATAGYESLTDFFRALGFDFVSLYPIIKEDKYILSHEPIYLPWESRFRNIYGHTHDKCVDANYFTHDYATWEAACRKAHEEGKPEPELTIDFPEKTVDTLMYYNACLDANTGYILSYEAIKKQVR